MAFLGQCLTTFAFLVLLVGSSCLATSPPQQYWNSMLPKNPIPKALQYILATDVSMTFDLRRLPKSYSTTVTCSLKYDRGVMPQGHPNFGDYILQKDLHSGTKITLQLSGTTTGAGFLPRATANSVPFSSAELPEIFKRFSVRPNSLEAKIMERTLLDCEDPGTLGTKKTCATSLESMVDFATSTLETPKVEAMATKTDQKQQDMKKQMYTIASTGVRQMEGENWVVCHPSIYPYAVFYCHMTKTKAYMVPLVGEDGSKVQSLVTCHTETSRWNPRFIAFQALKVRPGAVVCHFLHEDNILWTGSN